MGVDILALPLTWHNGTITYTATAAAAAAAVVTGTIFAESRISTGVRLDIRKFIRMRLTPSRPNRKFIVDWIISFIAVNFPLISLIRKIELSFFRLAGWNYTGVAKRDQIEFVKVFVRTYLV